jgi:hypothetical protein
LGYGLRWSKSEVWDEEEVKRRLGQVSIETYLGFKEVNANTNTQIK